MNRHVFGRFVIALLVSVTSGCTFYTACPPGAGTNKGATNGGGGTSGTSNAGGGTAGGLVGGGAVPGTWTNVTANLADLTSECGNMSFLSAKPDEDLLIAGIALQGLWSSQDGGGSWQRLGTSKGSDEIINRTSAIVYDPLDPKRYWESGLYDSWGAYETTDDGDTFAKLGTLTHSDLLSVDFSDPDRKTLLAGGHEMEQTLRLSTDGGQNWSNIGLGLPPATNCTTPLIIDPQTFLVGCGGLEGGVTGIYRSTDSGDTWSSQATSGGTSAPLRASDGSIYWASAGGGGLTRSTDDGLTWTDVVGGGVIKGVTPVELPDGRLATLGMNAVVTSADQGATWTEVSPALPYNDTSAVAYSVQQKAFYVWHFSCGLPPVPVPADAVMMFAFDYTAM